MSKIADERCKIIDNLESIFVYLRCANISTESMEGAIPIDCLATSDSTRDIGGCNFNPRQSGLEQDWRIKSVYIANEELNLMTACYLEWSIIWSQLEKHRKKLKILGHRLDHYATDYDCFSELYFSKVDKHGKFYKFPLDEKKYYSNGVKVSRLFNPRIAYGYKGAKWFSLEVDSEAAAKEGMLHRANELLVGLAAGIRAHWIAKVRIQEDVPSLSLLTDPTGVKELWKMRDVPAGKKRREALLNWVCDHWRQDRSDPEVEVYVRKHMRGQDLFAHGSMNVCIIPSEVATVEEALAKAERQVMRKASPRKDRRKRLLINA